MASKVARLALQDDQIELCGIIESPNHPSIGEDWGIVMGIGKTGITISDKLEDSIQGTDQIVEFTNPEVSLQHLKIAADFKKTMVIGTTGFSPEAIEEMKQIAENTPCLFSPNMSLGVNLLFKFAADIALSLGDGYDIEIVESHHRFKKDAPSGTAKKIAREIAKAKNIHLEDVAIYGREGMIGERKKGEIAIHSIRGGDITGEHTIIYTALGERVELTHRAHSRDTFAHGTIKAIKFMEGKSSGFYEMKDVLKL
jgi:4-hydroxy-tetrahydrodipicolinate reductase